MKIKDKDQEIMLGVPEEEEKPHETVELKEHRAMVCLPDSAVEATINAKVYHDGKLINVEKKMSMEDLREAFRKADDGYIDDEDRFVLTDEGRAYLDEIERKRNG